LETNYKRIGGIIMALQNTISFTSGIPNISNAYIRIDTISGNKNRLTIQVNSYVNQSAFTDGNPYVLEEQFTFTPSVEDGALNFIKQGYTYLKTLDKFKSAIDC